MDERSLSVEDAVQSLIQTEPEGQPTDEEVTDVTEAEPVEAEAEDDETEPDEDNSEEIEAEGEPDEDEEEVEEADEEDEDDPLVTLADGSELALSELQAGYMRHKDYTHKTMALGQDKKQFESERQQVTEYLKQQHAQLQDALATFAIQQDPAPDPESMSADEYIKAKARFDKKQAEKQQAAQMHQQLQQQQHQETLQREKAALLESIPEWNDPEVFQNDVQKIVRVGGEYGFSPDEMGEIVDHRMFKVLRKLERLEAAEKARKTNAAKVKKRVAKATKKPDPGSKPAKNQGQNDVRRQKLDRLKKTGSLRDAAAAIIMES